MDTLKDNYQHFISDPKRRKIFEREALALEVSELIHQMMKLEGVSKADLAKKIGSSKSHVSQLLNGSRNMTVHTLSDLAYALGRKWNIKAVALDAADASVPKYNSGEYLMYLPDGVTYPECSEYSDADRDALLEIPMPVAA